MNKNLIENFLKTIIVEFRQPLTLLMVPLEDLVSNDQLDAETRGKLQDMKIHATHLLEMVGQFSNPRNLSEKYLKANLTKIPLEERIKDRLMAILHKDSGTPGEIQLNWDKFTSQSGWLDTDKTEFILEFLFSFLRQATPNNGPYSIHIATESREPLTIPKGSPTHINPKGKFLSFSFHNFPVEVDLSQPVELEHVDMYSNEFGFSLCRQWTQMHLGEITQTLKTDGSRTLTAYFCIDEALFDAYGLMPLLPAPPSKTAPSHVDQPIGTDLEDEERKGKILVVEDDKPIQQLLEDVLSFDYEVITASNGIEGLEVAKDQIPDLILSDWKMPKMDGLELIQELKAHEETSDIPIILLTAYTNIQTRITGLKKGADDYIDKPFHREELLLRINNLLERIRSVQRRFFKDVNMKPEHMNINRAGKELLSKAITIVEENMENTEFRVEDFSDQMHMHKNSLNRKLKSITGLTANKFINNLRLKNAAKLLIEGKYTVGEIANMVGFLDQRYFSRTFSLHFGEAPSRFAAAYKSGKLKLDSYMLESIDMGDDIKGVQTASKT